MGKGTMWEPLIAAGGAAAAGAAFAWRWRRRTAEQADREAHLRHQEAVVDALAWMAAMKESAANMAESLNHASRLAHFSRSLNVLEEAALRDVARRFIPRLLQVQRFSVFIYRLHRRQLALFAHNHPEWDGLEEPLTVPADGGCGLMTDAIGARVPLVVPRFAESRYVTPENLHRYGTGPVVCVPLLAGGQVIGVLNLNEFTTPELNAGYMALVRQAADHFALALFNAHLVARINEQAIRDPLTGLYNRRHFQQAASQLATQAHRDQISYCILMFDMNGFKRINDTWGHATGDRMLKAVAAQIRATARKIDVPCRLGGDEFALLLWGASAEEAGRIADRIQAGVAGPRHLADGGEYLQLSVSVGLADSREGESWEQVLARADRQLYEIKRLDRVIPVLDARAR